MAVRVTQFNIRMEADEDKSEWSPTRAVLDAFMDGLRAFSEKFRGEMGEYTDQAGKVVVFEADLGFLPGWVRWIPFLRRIKVTVGMIDGFVDGFLGGGGSDEGPRA